MHTDIIVDSYDSIIGIEKENTCSNTEFYINLKFLAINIYVQSAYSI